MEDNTRLSTDNHSISCILEIKKYNNYYFYYNFISSVARCRCYKTFFFVINAAVKKARAFVYIKFFLICQIRAWYLDAVSGSTCVGFLPDLQILDYSVCKNLECLSLASSFRLV
jgi:hypothetical protein